MASARARRGRHERAGRHLAARELHCSPVAVRRQWFERPALPVPDREAFGMKERERSPKILGGRSRCRRPSWSLPAIRARRSSWFVEASRSSGYARFTRVPTPGRRQPVRPRCTPGHAT